MHSTTSVCTAWLIAALLVVMGAGNAFAQVDMVVRLDDAPPPEVRSALDSEADLADIAIELPDNLFDGVQSRRRLFERGTNRPSHTIDAYEITVRDSAAFHRLKSEWESTSGVAYVQGVHTYYLDDGIADKLHVPHQDSLHHLDVIRAREAWSLSTGNRDVTIGFIDTGLYFNHPDLRGKVAVHSEEDAATAGDCLLYPASEGGSFTGRDDAGNGYVDDVCGYNFVQRASSFFPHEIGRGGDPSEEPEHGHPHGTAVAGVLAASIDQGSIAGVAPGASILPLRAFDTSGQGRDTEISEAIVYAADLGVDVLNMSFGEIYHSPLLREAVEYAASRGVVMVASAGNRGNNDPHYPSDFDDVISVAWLNEDGTDRTPFSSYGSHLDLGAPASGVYTSTLAASDADPLYSRFSGSSFAAPQVAGAAALLLSIDDSLTPEGIRSVLSRSARPLRGGWNDRTGAGLLDVASALADVLPGSVAIDAPATDEGVAPGEIAVTGSASDPSFESFVLEYSRAEGYDNDAHHEVWHEVARSPRQVRNDTLGYWDTHNLEEGQYGLRLRVELRNGDELVSKNRVFLFRTAPEIEFRLVGEGISGSSRVIMADVETNGLSEVEMHIFHGRGEDRVESDRQARRHGLIWHDPRGDAETVRLQVAATNAAGMTATSDTTLHLSRWQLSRHLFDEESLDVPSGHLLPFATDMDEDGLSELVLSPYDSGTRTDTLAFYEWQGDRFARAHHITSGNQRQVIPRDLDATCATGGQHEAVLFTSTDGTGLFVPSEEGGFPTEEIDLAQHANDVEALFGITWIESDDGPLLVDWQTDTFRLLNCTAGSYSVVEVLQNPTPADGAHADSNRFDVPTIYEGDLTGNQRNNLLAGDLDGDWIMYENAEGPSFGSNWQFSTERTQAGGVFASGQLFDGDAPQFVTHNRAWPTAYRADSLRLEQEPPIHAFYLWESNQHGEPQLQDRFLIAGTERPTDMQAADVTGDGLDEIIVLLSPHLYVLSAANGSLSPIYHRGPGYGAGNYLDGDRFVADDVTGDGHVEIIVPAADGDMRRLAFHESAASYPPPRWVRARPSDEDHVLLEWRAESADSVQVFGAARDETLSLLATADSDSTVSLPVREHTSFRLRAWYDGAGSPLSEERQVITAPPAVVTEVSYPDPRRVNIVFSQPVDPSFAASQFSLQQNDVSASGYTMGQNKRGVYLKFDEAPQTKQDTLVWTGIKDSYGRATADHQAAVEFPTPDGRELIVEDWRRTGEQTVRLRFNSALDEEHARRIDNYEVSPFGNVATAEWDPASPNQVTLEIGGTRIGATGRDIFLRVLQMHAKNGQVLAPEGYGINLSEMADDLADVYVYPNPHHENHHSGPVRIAGLPREARVLILSVDGQRVTELEVSSDTGGVEWERSDSGGQPVPPGIYIVRVEAPDESPVLRKVAIIR